MTYKEEVLAALKKARTEAYVKYRRGTAWDWLEINVGDPGLWNGLRQHPFGSQYTNEELALYEKAFKISKTTTCGHGDYNSGILVMPQEWRMKSRTEVEKGISPGISKGSRSGYCKDKLNLYEI